MSSSVIAVHSIQQKRLINIYVQRNSFFKLSDLIISLLWAKTFKMNKNDSRLIVTLKTVNSAVKRVWSQLENQNWCLFAFKSDDEVVNISSQNTISVTEQYELQIQLNFDKKLKNFNKEFVFKSDSQKCDVLFDR